MNDQEKKRTEKGNKDYHGYGDVLKSAMNLGRLISNPLWSYINVDKQSMR